MRQPLLICLLVLALVAWLIVGIATPAATAATVDAQAQLAQEAPAAVDNSVIMAALVIVVPLVTVLINYMSTRNAAQQAAALAEQARALALSQRTVEALIVKLDGLPLRVAEMMANNLIREQYGDAMKKALTEAGIAKKDQPQEVAQNPLTPLRPVELIDQLELEKLDRDAAMSVAPPAAVPVSAATATPAEVVKEELKGAAEAIDEAGSSLKDAGKAMKDTVDGDAAA